MKARKLAAAALIAGGVPLVSAPVWAHADTGSKVTLCHRTDADNNPYVQITVDPDAVFRQGHDGHDGPVWNPSLKSSGEKWGDIIPPFDYTVKHGNQESTGHYPGKNWTSEGQAIQGNGCQVQQPASPSPTPTESSTPTPTQTSSSSSSPTPSQTVTPSGSPTRSETSSPTPTGSATSSPTASPSTTVLPTSSTRPPTIPTEVPTTPPTPKPGPTVSPKPQPLPHTGADTLPLMALGVGMTGAGAMLARVRRR